MGFKVERFTRKEDDLEVEDNDVFQELLSSGKEVWLVAKTKNSETLKKDSRVMVSTLNQSKPVPFIAKTLESLKNQSNFF